MLSTHGRPPSGVVAARTSVPHPGRAFLLLGSIVAVGVGMLVAVDGSLAAALGFVLTVLCLAAAGHVRSIFLAVLCVSLVGYAFLSRGFAYIGWEPFYVGEILLILALFALLGAVRTFRPQALHWAILLFCVIGVIRTVPFLDNGATVALRDAALWGYALFAFAASALLTQPLIERAVTGYDRLIPYFLAWLPFASYLYYTDTAGWETSSGVPLFFFKAGDAAVHLAGVAAFLLLGLRGSHRRLPLLGCWICWLFSAILVFSVNRGGILAVSSALLLTIVLARPKGTARFLLALATVSAILFAIQPRLAWSGSARSISTEQIITNVTSIGTSSEDARDGSKDWRLAWWSEIYQYTVRGQYFWGGKGFGINLADDDGFQVGTDASLRAPHNTHVTVLARMGVPAFVLWVALQILFAGTMLGAIRRARITGAVRWMRIDIWLLAYWLAMVVNTSFDPYLEGPQGGIWFWTVVGFGLAALQCQRVRRNSSRTDQLEHREQRAANHRLRATFP
jgi:hypothetical protein